MRQKTVRGCQVTEQSGNVSFACDGDPIPDATWDGPRGIIEGRPLSHVSLPENFQETGFAEAVALALEQTGDV